MANEKNLPKIFALSVTDDFINKNCYSEKSYGSIIKIYFSCSRDSEFVKINKTEDSTTNTYVENVCHILRG